MPVGRSMRRRELDVCIEYLAPVLTIAVGIEAHIVMMVFAETEMLDLLSDQ